MQPTWLDRALGWLSPSLGLKRVRARAVAEIIARHYEGASVGRRTEGWRRPSTDANAASGPSLANLRNAARDLVRNNPYAESAVTTIGDHVVGWGITGKPAKGNARAAQLWNEWAGSTACDSDGRNDFAGLQKLVMQTVVESGEVLIRRRFRRPEDGLPIPLQLQVLEPDYLDTLRTGVSLPNGGRIVHGVEFDALGRRVAYWLFSEHPGAQLFAVGQPWGASRRIPAESILHVYRQSRAGQVRGPSWFAPVLLRFKDFDEYEDATLMKQKIAACLAVIVSDPDGSATPLGTADESQSPEFDSLEPGMILNAPPGRAISVVSPPSVTDHADYSKVTLRAIATGLGVTYEDLTGDYTGMPFSAARMSRLRHWARVDGWRWRTLIPQFCAPVWSWAMEAAQIMGQVSEAYGVEWTAPPPPMIDPAVEGLAYTRNIRSGIMTLSEALRERGYDPQGVLDERAKDDATLDRLGIMLDSDPRRTSQAGLTQVRAGSQAAPADEPPDPAADEPAAPAAADEPAA